jgi:hypothetical protein
MDCRSLGAELTFLLGSELIFPMGTGLKFLIGSGLIFPIDIELTSLMGRRLRFLFSMGNPFISSSPVGRRSGGGGFSSFVGGLHRHEKFIDHGSRAVCPSPSGHPLPNPLPSRERERVAGSPNGSSSLEESEKKTARRIVRGKEEYFKTTIP